MRFRVCLRLEAADIGFTTSGMEDQNNRLAEMAERHLERQAEQTRRVTELQHEIAEGSQ